VSDQIELQKIVGQVAASYFNNSHVTPSEIPQVISNIAAGIAAVGAAPVVEAPPEEPQLSKPSASEVRKSITKDKLISFEDGKGYKTLRRHLAVRGLSPEDYRSKWGLPKDYPMVAPGYSEARSSLAKAAGFGSARATSAPAAAAPAAPAAAAEPAPAAPPAAVAAAKRASPAKIAATGGRKTRAAAPRKTTNKTTRTKRTPASEPTS
jgi:predicted transcriptional regulator